MTRIDYRSGLLAIAAMALLLAGQVVAFGPGGGLDIVAVIRAAGSGVLALGIAYGLERAIDRLRGGP